MTTAPEPELPLHLRLRRAREAAGLSRYKLAKRAKLSLIHVSRMERGEVQPRLDTLRKLAAGLGISLGELLGPPPRP